MVSAPDWQPVWLPIESHVCILGLDIAQLQEDPIHLQWSPSGVLVACWDVVIWGFEDPLDTIVHAAAYSPITHLEFLSWSWTQSTKEPLVILGRDYGAAPCGPPTGSTASGGQGSDASD